MGRAGLTSAPGGHPDQVRSLIALLRQCGGSVSTDKLRSWLTPVSHEGKEANAVEETIKAARGLGIVSQTDDVVQLDADVPVAPVAYSDWVHAQFLEVEEDHAGYTILEYFAWITARSAQEGGTHWMGASRHTADKANFDLEATASSTKPQTTNVKALDNWLTACGLGWTYQRKSTSGGSSARAFLPDPTDRMVRVLQASKGAFAERRMWEASAFVEELASWMPYLDGGRIFRDVHSELKHEESKTLSPVLSKGLTQLHEDEYVELNRTPDASGMLSLHPSTTPAFDQFSDVTVRTNGGIEE